MTSSAVRRARELRKESTEAELKLWQQLRSRRVLGAKFRRQVPIAGFVADFCCFDPKLVIEVDGGQHSERLEEDRERTKVLELHGYRVVRFWNHDVLNDIDAVLTTIESHIRSPHPNPLPEGEGT